MLIDVDDETIERVVTAELLSIRDCFKEDYGSKSNVFFWEQHDMDDAEIQRHIDAVELILKWYLPVDKLNEIGLEPGVY